MLSVNLASLQSAARSNPVTDRKVSTSETDANTAPMMPVMPATYQYPMMYNPMARMATQPAQYQMVPAPTPANTPVMPMQSGSPPVAPTLSPANSTEMLGCHYTYTSESLYQMAQAGTPIVPTPAQPHTYHQQAVISVKPADQMNVFETSNWVRLVGEVQGWPEAPVYARSFFNNGVTGFMLSQLTIESLEKYLGVEKHGHRLTLMTAIRAIYPYLIPMESSSNLSSAAPSVAGESTTAMSELDSDADGSQRELKLQMQNSQGRRRSVLVGDPLKTLNQQNLVAHDMETIRFRRPQLIDESSCTSNNSMSSRFSASSQATDTTNSTLNGDRRCHLTLTMQSAPACNREAMLAIRTTFSSAGFDAHPRPSERATNKFIIRFPTEAEAERALLMKAEIGYDLSNYTEFSRKKGPRPTPSNPQQYMVLHHAQVRKGKSMKSQVLGFVEKGEVYWVNQIKGKRARLVERCEGEEDRNMGWVSLRNNAGYQLMAPFHE